MLSLVRGYVVVSAVVLGHLSGIVIFGCMLIMTYGVFVRYVLRSPLVYGYELGQYTLFWLVAAGLAYAQQKKAHVRIDTLLTHLPERVRNTLEIINLLLFLSVSVLFLWAGWELAWTSLVERDYAIVMRVPFFAVQLILIVGVCILALQLMVDIHNRLTARARLE